MGSWIELVRDINFASQINSVAVTVTRPAPDDDAIETRGIWMTPGTEAVPTGAEFSRREPVRVMALRRDEVPTVPRGTRILAPEPGGTAVLGWKVDAFDSHTVDHQRVIVVRAPEMDP